MYRKQLTTILVIAVCVGAVFLFRALKFSDPSKIAVEQRSKGDKNAPVQIIEYFDYQCPPCANARKVLEDHMKAHPGKYHLQARYFPLPSHKNGLKAAIHAECAARQGYFWDFHGQLFDHQPEWANDDYAEIRFIEYAEGSGIDLRKWDVCVQDPKVADFVMSEKKEGQALGVAITPSFMINKKLVVGNYPLLDELKRLEAENT